MKGTFCERGTVNDQSLCVSDVASELDFHIWNANWPMKCEAKMAAHAGQLCTSVLVS